MSVKPTGTEVAQALADHLSVIPGVRVHAYMPDAFLPPGIVVHQPSIVWDTGSRTFCTREFTFPVSIVVARTHDRTAQAELDTILMALEEAIDRSPTVSLLNHMRLITATPEAFTVAGVDLPGYSATIQILA